MSKQVEQYLNQLRSQLKRLPAEQREAEVEEIHQHLLALIDHRVEQGEELEAATAAAIKQFGTPQANGKALRKTWRRGEFLANGRLVARLHLWVAGIVIFQFVAGLLFSFIPFSYRLSVYPLYFVSQAYYFTPGWSFLLAFAFVLFTICSLRFSRKLRVLFFVAVADMTLLNISTFSRILVFSEFYVYLLIQLSLFALSVAAVWLIMKQGKTPMRAS